MKELAIIEEIKKSLSSDYIGDDCANLKDLGIVVTQDSLVEDVHFLRRFATPFQLGYKSIAVNISDIYAAGAIPKYFTVSLSLPKNIETDFIKDFYEGAKEALNGAIIVGGDVTGADKIFISVAAIGSTKGRNISSRKNAKVGYKIITNGVHGSGSAGLYAFLNNLDVPQKITNAHLMPEISPDLSETIATFAKKDYAMMDSSDGLMDAIFKIAQSSNLTAKIDFQKIPYDKEIENIKDFDYKNAIFYGGEDYKLICAVSNEDLAKVNKNLYTEIGEFIEKTDENFIVIKYNENVEYLKKEDIEQKLFLHF